MAEVTITFNAIDGGTWPLLMMMFRSFSIFLVSIHPILRRNRVVCLLKAVPCKSGYNQSSTMPAYVSTALCGTGQQAPHFRAYGNYFRILYVGGLSIVCASQGLKMSLDPVWACLLCCLELKTENSTGKGVSGQVSRSITCDI